MQTVMENKLRLVAIVVDTEQKQAARVGITALPDPLSLDGRALALRSQMSEEEFLDKSLSQYRADFGQGFRDINEGGTEPRFATRGYRMGCTAARHFGRGQVDLIEKEEDFG